MKKESLFILPFDHRSSFLKKMLGIEGRKPSDIEIDKVKELKEIVYLGFKWAIKNGGVPKDSSAILVDEQFGDGVIKEALKEGYTICISTEKSGQDEFEFEYGDDFGKHLDVYRPSFAKALVRYNPEGDKNLNARQREKLKKLSDFCKEKNYSLMIEPLVSATNEQMEKVNNEKERYDNELRPGLMIQMISEMKNDNIAPDIWKIEGLEKTSHYQALAEVVGPDAKIIILGRGSNEAQVKKWLLAGAKIKEVIGFAIGRTVFWDSLVSYNKGKIKKEIAIKTIAEKYKMFYDIFTKAKKENERLTAKLS